MDRTPVRRGRRRPALLITALFSIAALTAGNTGVNAAPPDGPLHHWQFDHWPQQQPWQQTRDSARVMAQAGFPGPVDPQNWVNPDHMTWERDYRKIPGTNWADPSATGSVRTWSVSVPNALATASFGGRVEVPVHAKRDGGPIMSKVTLTAVSESNPGRSATASCTVVGR